KEVAAPVAVEVAGQRQIPSEIFALVLLALPEFLAGLGRPHHQQTPRGPLGDACVGRRDDHVREPIAREVRHRHHPLPTAPIRPLTVPLADGGTARTRPHRSGSVLLGFVPERETGPGGDVRMPVAVRVERLTEAKSQLAIPDAAGETARHAPPGPGSRAGRYR